MAVPQNPLFADALFQLGYILVRYKVIPYKYLIGIQSN